MQEIEIDNFNINVSENNYNSCTIETVENNIQYQDFFEKYMIKNLPCVVKNINHNWECVTKWVKDETVNYDYLVANYGDLEAPVADCDNVVYNNSHCKSIMKVSKYIEYLSNDSKDNLLYLKDWHLKKLLPEDNFYQVPLIFASDWLNEFAEDQHDDDFKFVYIGPKNSWTPLHADVYSSYSWSVNIVGRKRWILFPPGEESKLKDSLGNLPLLFYHENYKNIKYFEVIQEKGDAIFVPSGWHHQVSNLLDTISINHNWINGCNIEYVWEALQENLLSVEHEIEEFRDTEDFDAQCQLILKSVFGMNFQMFIIFVCHIGKKRIKQLQTTNFREFNVYIIGKNHIIFDLKTIGKIIDKIINHNLFLNKNLIPLQIENEVLILRKSVLEYTQSIHE